MAPKTRVEQHKVVRSVGLFYEMLLVCFIWQVIPAQW